MFKHLIAVTASLTGIAAAASGAELQWNERPPLPVPLAGHFAGTHNGVLIVAGGSNFPVSPFQGGEKQFLDRIYILEHGAEAWRDFGALPEPRAYGASVSNGEGVWLIAGTDGTRNFDNVLRLRWEHGNLVVDAASPLQSTLPRTLAMHGAAIIDDTVYVFGGQSTPDAAVARDGFYSLDLTTDAAEWSALDAGPVSGRILPVVTARDGALYVVSGARLEADAAGQPQRTYLADAYRYDPASREWETLTGPPRPVVAAPAIPYGLNHLFVFGGDDGALATRTQELADRHPGFPDTVLAYHTITDSWAEIGRLPASLVTTAVIEWNGQFIIPAGEDRPGHRVPAVLAGTLTVAHGGLGAIDYAAIAIYLSILVGMGWYFSRREKTTENFFLGGRRVPWWAVGLSIFGTSLSAITYLSIPAQAYATNWVFFLANFSMLLVAPIVVAYYIPHFRRSPISTAYEYLERRFNLATRIYGSLCFMAFQTFRVSIVLFLPAMALAAATGFNVYWCIALMGVLATLYTVLGGIEAVIWTDVLQAIVLVFGAVLALALIILNVDGGVSAIVAEAGEAGKLHAFNWSWDITVPAVWVILIGNAFSNMYPSTADQTIVQRYLTTRSGKEAGKAVWTNALLSVPITILFFSLGTALWAYFRQHPAALDPTLKNDAILPLFIVEEFPAGLRGIIIAGIFAAAMSSLDSSINSVASVLVNDYYRRFRPALTDRQALVAARIITAVFGLFGTLAAVYVANLNATSLWDPFLKYVGLVGGGLAGIFALGVFTTRANGAGAIIGAVVSAIVLYWVSTRTGAHGQSYGLIAFTTAFAVGYVASRMFPDDESAGESRTGSL